MIKRLKVMGLGLLGCLLACGPVSGPGNVTASQTNCEARTAQIWIADGFMKRLCGCAEPSDATFGQGAALACTVSRGTTVFFTFSGTKLRHQVGSVGQPSFPSSPVSDPKKTKSPRSHGVTLGTTGTYTFSDTFQAGLGGTITVN